MPIEVKAKSSAIIIQVEITIPTSNILFNLRRGIKDVIMTNAANSSPTVLAVLQAIFEGLKEK